jgi:hypothetical protein
MHYVLNQRIGLKLLERFSFRKPFALRTETAEADGARTTIPLRRELSIAEIAAEIIRKRSKQPEVNF